MRRPRRRIALLGVLAVLAAVAVVVVVLAGSGPEGDGGRTASVPSTAPRPAPAPPRDPLVFGLSEIRVDSLLDPRAQALRVRQVRRIVPYNAMESQVLVDEFRTLYDEAARQGVELMVSFDFRCDPLGSCYEQRNFDHVPSVREYLGAVRAFRAAFPRVRYLSAWNEPNHQRSPLRRTGAGPGRAALFTFLLARDVCSDEAAPCEVVAGEFSQNRGEWQPYVRAYAASLARRFARAPEAGPPPRIWGLHPYVDVEDELDPGTNETGVDQLVAMAPPGARIWFTEVGSRVDASGNAGRRRNGEASQAREVAYLVDVLARSHPTIERLYYYAFCDFATEDPTHFDTMLLGALPDVTEEPYVRPGATCAEQPERRAYRTLLERARRAAPPS